MIYFQAIFQTFRSLWVFKHCYIVYIFLDIIECEGDPCHVNATCENTIGSFICRCIGRYRGDGFNCEGKNFTLINSTYDLSKYSKSGSWLFEMRIGIKNGKY